MALVFFPSSQEMLERQQSEAKLVGEKHTDKKRELNNYLIMNHLSEDRRRSHPCMPIQLLDENDMSVCLNMT